MINQTSIERLVEEIGRQLDRLENEVLPTHAEMNGYGCAVNDVREILSALTTEGE